MTSWCSCRESEAQNPWRHWTVRGPGQAQQEATAAGGSASRLAQTLLQRQSENWKQNTDNDSVREKPPQTVITSQQPRAQTHMNYKMNKKTLYFDERPW